MKKISCMLLLSAFCLVGCGDPECAATNTCYDPQIECRMGLYPIGHPFCEGLTCWYENECDYYEDCYWDYYWDEYVCDTDWDCYQVVRCM